MNFGLLKKIKLKFKAIQPIYRYAYIKFTRYGKINNLGNTLGTIFRKETLNTIMDLLNKITFKPISMTPYELWIGKKAKLKLL